MLHPLIESLSKITHFLFVLGNDRDIDQLLEERCKDYKDRLLQFKIAFDRQFTLCKDPLTERVLFDISLAGLRIDEIFYTFTGKLKIVKKNMAAMVKRSDLGKKPNSVLDTRHSKALRAKLASEKKQSSKVFPVTTRVPSEKPLTEYNVFIVIHGLLQGDVTLVDDFLNNHNEIANFLEKNMSFLTEAFSAWEQTDSLSSYKKIHAIANDQWLTAFKLAINEVGTLVWYYTQRRMIERQSMSIEKNSRVLMGNIQEDTDNPSVDTVYPFFFSRNIVGHPIKLDYLKYACIILTRRFPIGKLWAVENLLKELKTVDHISAENESKLHKFNALLAELPVCVAINAYRKAFQEIIDKLHLATVTVPKLTRQDTPEYPQADENESTLSVTPSAIEVTSAEVKTEEKDTEEVKNEGRTVQFKRPLDRKRIRGLVPQAPSASDSGKKQKSVTKEDAQCTLDNLNPPQLKRTSVKRSGAFLSSEGLGKKESHVPNNPLENPVGISSDPNLPRLKRKPLERLGAHSNLNDMIRESMAKDDSNKRSATLSHDTSELPGHRPT